MGKTVKKVRYVVKAMLLFLKNILKQEALPEIIYKLKEEKIFMYKKYEENVDFNCYRQKEALLFHCYLYMYMVY